MQKRDAQHMFLQHRGAHADFDVSEGHETKHFSVDNKGFFDGENGGGIQ